MNTKTKAKKATSRTPHAPHKIRAGGRWAAVQRPHRAAPRAAASSSETTRESPDSETI